MEVVHKFKFSLDTLSSIEVISDSGVRHSEVLDFNIQPHKQIERILSRHFPGSGEIISLSKLHGGGYLVTTKYEAHEFHSYEGLDVIRLVKSTGEEYVEKKTTEVKRNQITRMLKEHFPYCGNKVQMRALNSKEFLIHLSH